MQEQIKEQVRLGVIAAEETARQLAQNTKLQENLADFAAGIASTLREYHNFTPDRSVQLACAVLKTMKQ